MPRKKTTIKELAGLAERMLQIKLKFKENAEKAAKVTAIAFDQTVVLETPVDTGRARSNWVVGINQPNREVVSEGFPKSTKNIKRDGEKAKNTITEGQANQIANEQLQKVTATILGANDVKQIYISNNLPYIKRLNNGYSKQAPKNFVERALKAAINALEAVDYIE